MRALEENSSKIYSGSYSSYASCAKNLLSFLDIFGAEILVVGSALSFWQKLFPNAYFLEKLSTFDTNRKSYDLILYHSGVAMNRIELNVDLQILKKMAGKHGQIFYFAENFLSFANLKQLLIHRKFYQLRRLYCSPLYFHRIFSQSSISVAKEFVGIPKYETAEEMVVLGSQFLEISPHFHAVYRLAAHMHRYHWLADGRIYLISNLSLEDRTASKTAARQIQRYLNTQRCLCTVERFDLRLRGSLVIFITEQNSRKSFISRIVSNPYVKKIVCRNHNFLNVLHKSSRLPVALKRKLPEPIGELEYPSYTLFTETLIQGKLAWKVNQGSLRKVIFAEAVKFITDLQLSMQQSMLLTPDHAEEFFRGDVQRICSIKTCDPELAAGILRAVKKIRRLLSDRTFPLTISHGDYGYGNILVHPVTGHLTGVIDWDTGRERDLPGIDYLNLAVQKIRSEIGYSVAQAFTKTTEIVLRRGAIDDKNFYSSRFDITGERLKMILYACLIRYMSRAAQYPEIFYQEQDEYLVSLNFLVKLAPL